MNRLNQILFCNLDSANANLGILHSTVDRLQRLQVVEIIVNSKNKSVPDDLTLTGLIAMLELVGQRFAIEVNQQVIPRAEHANYTLQANDKIA